MIGLRRDAVCWRRSATQCGNRRQRLMQDARRRLARCASRTGNGHVAARSAVDRGDRAAPGGDSRDDVQDLIWLLKGIDLASLLAPSL